jgi:hypothetical protein
MNKLTPQKILRNLENGYFMTPIEQSEAADFIRELQACNAALAESMIRFAEEIVALRRDLNQATRGQK